AQAASGEILFGQGDNSPLDPNNTIDVTSADDVFGLLQGTTRYYATSIANGGNLYNLINGSPDTGYPELLLVVDGQLYEEPSFAAYGSFVGLGSSFDLASYNPYCLAQNDASNTTGCTTDWTGWTITSTLAGDDRPALFARDTSSSPTD